MALAPSALLFGVPSRLSSASSRATWSSAERPSSNGAIRCSTFATAWRTPLPPNTALSPSRSSSASCVPVDAPEGTAARPRLPSSRRISTSTVGFPRESRIWRALIRSMIAIRRPPRVAGGASDRVQLDEVRPRAGEPPRGADQDDQVAPRQAPLIHQHVAELPDHRGGIARQRQEQRLHAPVEGEASAYRLAGGKRVQRHRRATLGDEACRVARASIDHDGARLNLGGQATRRAHERGRAPAREDGGL